jgi:hypothetical protein
MRKQYFNHHILLSCLVLILLIPTTIYAEMSLEGFFSKNDKKLSIESPIVLTLRVYDSEYNGILLYEEQQTIQSENGKISFTFGKGDVTVQKKHFKEYSPEKLWVEVVSDKQVMIPRINLGSIDSDQVSELMTDGARLANTTLRSKIEPSIIIGKSGINLGDVIAPLTVSGEIAGGSVIKAANDTTSSGTAIEGSVVNGSAISGTVSGIYSYGLYGAASGMESSAVYGLASYDDGACYGGEFESRSQAGKAVFGKATHTGHVKNYGGYFTSSGEGGMGVYGEATNTIATASGVHENYGGYFKAAAKNGVGVYGEGTGEFSFGGHFVGQGWPAGVGVLVEAEHIGLDVKATGPLSKGIKSYGTGFDFYAVDNDKGSDYGPFTGAHEVILSPACVESISPGMLVSVTGKVFKHQRANGKFSLSSTLPEVDITNKANDKAVLGVFITKSPLPKEHWYKAKKGECFAIVNALGEGCMWVCESNGNIEAGDALTSSSVSGYAQRQDDDLIHRYTIGWATENIDWSKIDKTIEYNGRSIKIHLTAVIYTSG